MKDLASVVNTTRGGRTLRLAFVSAVVSLVAVFAAVGSTIPLFNIYRAEDGFTNAGISMTVVACADRLNGPEPDRRPAALLY
jgi:hypothetical protein